LILSVLADRPDRQYFNVGSGKIGMHMVISLAKDGGKPSDCCVNETSVLVIFAHPAFQKSRVNRALVEAARSVYGVTVHDLYETYPDFLIDVEEEQKLLESHQHVVLQHPFFWYSSPAIIKEWLDLVLTYGWAYGNHGTALTGKTLVQAISTGGPAEAYQRGGYNHFTLRELLAPFEQTARLCGMRYAEAFTVQDTNGLSVTDLATHAARYTQWLEALRDGKANYWLTPTQSEPEERHS
jgi:glutathione-regulated potassium-efflux system ancillary protein KefG